MDFYEMSMANGYFISGMRDTIGYFDLFFRRIPDNGGFAIMAGVEQIVDYLKNLRFTQEDLELLRRKGMSEDFLNYLRDFHFECDLWAVP